MAQICVQDLPVCPKPIQVQLSAPSIELTKFISSELQDGQNGKEKNLGHHDLHT